ncbi:uncharacterized protein CLUP02_15288 [Colletotrichum lupini]|uniref:Uncharacterized protein n=1 Tax=Colletotrichum lupini TaxID=145971 RepID=A0A9Q8T5Y6_9PEZI|nr:uncharacterized protein CLUP02_15288 [Colletotrichum lupini]UQC89757.1 hypothetical protein CLUP02_15288 [Colletotrichum lupini]
MRNKSSQSCQVSQRGLSLYDAGRVRFPLTCFGTGTMSRTPFSHVQKLTRKGAHSNPPNQTNLILGGEEDPSHTESRVDKVAGVVFRGSLDDAPTGLFSLYGILYLTLLECGAIFTLSPPTSGPRSPALGKPWVMWWDHSNPETFFFPWYLCFSPGFWVVSLYHAHCLSFFFLLVFLSASRRERLFNLVEWHFAVSSDERVIVTECQRGRGVTVTPGPNRARDSDPVWGAGPVRGLQDRCGTDGVGADCGASRQQPDPKFWSNEDYCPVSSNRSSQPSLGGASCSLGSSKREAGSSGHQQPARMHGRTALHGKEKQNGSETGDAATTNAVTPAVRALQATRVHELQSRPIQLVASPFAKDIALPRRPCCHCMVEAHSEELLFNPPPKQALARITPSYMDRNLFLGTDWGSLPFYGSLNLRLRLSDIAALSM